MILTSSIVVVDSDEETYNETNVSYFVALPDYFVTSEEIISELTDVIETDEFVTNFFGNSTTIYDFSMYTHSISTNNNEVPSLEVPYIEW